VKYLKKDYVIKGYLFPDASGKPVPPAPQSSMSGDSHGKTYNKDLGSKVDLKKYITAESDYKVELKNKIKRKVLPNGVIILAMQNPNFDIVAVKGTLLAGPAFDKKGKYGLATLTVSCLGYGTTTRDKQKIEVEKDLISLRGDIDTGLETVTFNYSMVSNQYDPAMALVSDFIINPTFPEKHFNQQKMSFLMYHQQLAQSPDELVGKTFKKLLYGEGHPYSHYQYGDAAEFKTLTLEDVKQFHKDNYGPENCIIGVVGPQSPNELIRVIEKYFGKWSKTGKVNKVDFGDMKPLDGIKEKSISLPGRTQTNIRMGWPGIKVGDEDYYPLMILNFVMGGGSLSSRLGSEIRVKSGLAYSVHSYIHPRTFKGSINIVTSTQAGNEELVKKKIIMVIKEIIKNGISDEELFISKQYMINSSPRSMETNGQLVGSIEYMEYMNLGMDYYDNYTDKIKKVTSEDIKRVAKKYLDTEKYIWVQVGP
ncbi:insulinase family protein, partial [Candidatus Dependentiae bacterium]|nr:insulinase family protein [Candidatus Dependentiae bacterium]